MTEEELSKMISEFLPYPAEGQHHALKQFAALVAAAEREACAKVCDELEASMQNGKRTKDGDHAAFTAGIIAERIRARGAP